MKLLPVNVNTIATSLLRGAVEDASVTEKAGKPAIELTYKEPIVKKETIDSIKENQDKGPFMGGKIDIYA